jgi:hypothetical protein
MLGFHSHAETEQGRSTTLRADHKAWMRLIFLMSHFQVSQDLDESFSSLSN